MKDQSEEIPIRDYADYIRRAEEADGMAAMAKDEAAQKSFRMVAAGWRHLAEQVKRRLWR